MNKYEMFEQYIKTQESFPEESELSHEDKLVGLLGCLEKMNKILKRVLDRNEVK